MADRASPLISSFNSGELSKKSDARPDLAKYYSGCRTLLGMVPYIEGKAVRIPGTYFIHEVKMPDKKSRLVPFHFSTVQAYIVEFGDLYIRFYMNDGIIMSGVNVYEVTSPYLEADLPKLKFVQSADVLYIFHPSYPTKKLTRYAHTSWTLTNFIARTQNPFTITSATKANPCVITATFTDTVWATSTYYPVGSIRVYGVPHYYCLVAHTSGTFSIDLAKEYWAIMDIPATGSVVHINGIVGMTELNDNFYTVIDPSDGAEVITFKLSGIDSSAYTAYTSGGTAQKVAVGTPNNRPSCGAFFGQRLIIAGMANYPQTLYISHSADYEDFTLNPDDDSAGLQYTLTSGKMDRIRWMVGEDILLLGTTGGIWKFIIPTTPTTSPPSAVKHIHIGVQDIEPKAVGGYIFWVTRSGLSLRQLTYDFNSDKYISPDMTRLARHITLGTTVATSGITSMDYQQEPMPILWCVRADGQLLGFVADLQENVFAWFRVVTDGLFESMAVISQDGEEDQVWVIVNRTIGGVTKRYVEFFMPHEFYSNIANCFFVHSGLSNVYGSPTSLITGLIHLAGKSVVALVDGLAQGPFTVTGGGEITLTTPGIKVHVGLPFTSDVEPMKLHAGSQLGTARGKKQRVNKVTCCFYETGKGVTVGADSGNLKEVMDLKAGELNTIDSQFSFSGNWGDEATLYVRQTKPLPMTILALVPHVSLNE